MPHGKAREGARVHRRYLLGLTSIAGTVIMLTLYAHSTLRERHFSHSIESPKADTNIASTDRQSDIQTPSTRSQSRKPMPEHCPIGMVRVSAGTFRPSNSQFDVRLSGYCIDETEVTVVAYEACVEAKGCSAGLLTVNGYPEDFRKIHNLSCNRKSKPDHPMNCVDFNQAIAYCKWASKRLPTDVE